MGVYTCTCCREQYTDVRFLHEEYAAAQQEKESRRQSGELAVDTPGAEAGAATHEQPLRYPGNVGEDDTTGTVSLPNASHKASAPTTWFDGIARVFRRDSAEGDGSAKAPLLVDDSCSDRVPLAADGFASASQRAAAATHAESVLSLDGASSARDSDTKVALRFNVGALVYDHERQRCRVAKVDPSDSEKPYELEYPNGARYWSSDAIIDTNVPLAEDPTAVSSSNPAPAYDITNGDKLLASYLGLPPVGGRTDGRWCVTHPMPG